MVTRAEQQERTRRAIVDAMSSALLDRAYPAIRVADVARAAGVSAQTLHEHFGSKEALFLVAVAELGQEALAERAAPQPGDVAAVVSSLVRQYERYGDVNWGLLPLERESEAVAAALAMGRRGHRAWLEQVFAPRLPHDAAARRRVVDALYGATDVGTWKLFRRDLRLSRRRTSEAMRVLVEGALAGTDRR
jgi:AcrR family transcriptional regulator